MSSSIGGRAVCFASALVAALAVGTASSAQQTVMPSGPPWKVKPAFEKTDKVREAISGAACALTLPPTCLAANDEANYAQFFSIKGRKLDPSRLIRLVPDKENGVAIGSLDAEGVAYDHGFFYVIGSHGAPRNPTAAVDPSRFFLLRFRVSERTGKPRFRFGEETVDTTAVVKTSALRDVIKSATEIGAFAEKPLGENGVNIEGIVVREDRMFLGLRAPSVNGRGYILEVNVGGVFGSDPIKPKVHGLPLGADAGVRDLAVLRKAPGLLVLAGPVQSAGSYSVHYWDGQSAGTKPLAVLGGLPAGAKPETLLVLNENNAKQYRVLVLLESVINASPLEYLIPR